MEGNLTLQVRISAQQMDKLEQEAKEMKISVPEYVRGKLFGVSDFSLSEYYNLIIKFLEKVPIGTEFTLPQLFQWEWDSLPVSIRISLGRYFNSMVLSQKIQGVYRLDKTRQHIQVYLKNKERGEFYE